MANDIEELYLNGTRYGFNDERLANKANIDGAYETMTVGNAEQLVSSVRVTDKTPYLFRTAGGNLDIGDRKYTTLVGADVAVNQLAVFDSANIPSARGGVTFSYVDGKSFKINGTATADSTASGWFGLAESGSLAGRAGHKMLVIPRVISGSINSGVTYSWDGSSYIQWSVPTIRTLTPVNNQLRFIFAVSNGTVLDNVILSFNVIDLTAYYGSNAIPDLAHTKEQATAGSGIAWLKANGFDFSKYTAYNAGSLEAVNPSAIVTRGFNQWDEEWELGTIDASGNNSPSSTTIRSKNFIRAIPNTAYCENAGNGTMQMFYYDSNQAFISSEWLNASFVTPANCSYIKFRLGSGYGTTYKNDICINLHWDGSRDGEYEQYSEHTYDLGNVPLHGVFKEENGNIVAYGDTRTSDGTKTNNFGQLDLGTKTWYYNTTSAIGPYFYCYIAGTSTPPIKREGDYWNTIYSAICPKYVTVARVADTFIDKTITFDGDATVVGQIQIKDSAYTDAATFKTAMSGVMLTYELATPTEETVTGFTNPQVVDNWGTEEFTTENDVPVGNETEYPQNLRDKLESIPNPPNGDGDYIVRQTGGTGEYRAVSDNAIIQGILAKLPNAPSEDGAYKLTCTVTNGTAVYSWEAE